MHQRNKYQLVSLVFILSYFVGISAILGQQTVSVEVIYKSGNFQRTLPGYSKPVSPTSKSLERDSTNRFVNNTSRRRLGVPDILPPSPVGQDTSSGVPILPNYNFVGRQDLQNILDKLNNQSKLSAFVIAWKIIRMCCWTIAPILIYFYLLDNLGRLKEWSFEFKWPRKKKTKRTIPKLARELKEQDFPAKLVFLVESKNYVEAIHEMLKHLIHQVEYRLDTTISSAYTTREVIKKARISIKSKQNLQVIATEVEHCFFGQKHCSESDYQRCRKSYLQFLEQIKTPMK